MGENCRRLMVAILAVIVLFAVADIFWLPGSNVSIDPHDLYGLGRVEVVLLLAFVTARAVVQRLGSDDSPTSRLIGGMSERLRLGTVTFLFFVPVLYVGAVFSYLASATARPLFDAKLVAVDSALGFDWLRFLETANASPLLSKLLVLAYHSLTLQVPVAALLLCLTFRTERLFEFVALFAVSLFLTCLVMASCPAAGAYAHFQPPADSFSNFTAKAGMWHFTDLRVLRSGEAFQFSFGKMQGLVTFPSFHTALGIIVTYALRDFRILVLPVTFLNAVMLVGTLPEGGHYLVDILAGFSIAVLSILIIKYKVNWHRAESPSPATLRGTL
jgi:membrane-associated phospholipid phosphatase